jgi:hypothetical protein
VTVCDVAVALLRFNFEASRIRHAVAGTPWSGDRISVAVKSFCRRAISILPRELKIEIAKIRSHDPNYYIFTFRITYLLFASHIYNSWSQGLGTEFTRQFPPIPVDGILPVKANNG